MALGFVLLSIGLLSVPFERAECELQPQKVINLHHFNGKVGSLSTCEKVMLKKLYA